MSLATQEADVASTASAAPLATHDDEPSGRGSLTIAEKAIERIATQAVSEVDLATGAPRKVLGVRMGSADGHQDARASAQVDGQLVTMSVTLAVQWPAPVRQVCAQVRQHLAERVGAMTGLQVAEIDVDVPTLITGRKPDTRVR